MRCTIYIISLHITISNYTVIFRAFGSALWERILMMMVAESDTTGRPTDVTPGNRQHDQVVVWRWPSLKPTQGQCLVLPGMSHQLMQQDPSLSPSIIMFQTKWHDANLDRSAGSGGIDGARALITHLVMHTHSGRLHVGWNYWNISAWSRGTVRCHG